MKLGWILTTTLTVLGGVFMVASYHAVPWQVNKFVIANWTLRDVLIRSVSGHWQASIGNHLLAIDPHET